MNRTILDVSRAACLALVLSVFPFTFFSSLYADSHQEAAQDNLISLHSNIVNSEKPNCSDCHADIHNRLTLDPDIPDAHVAMLPFAPGGSEDEDKRDQRCAWCHRSVDLVHAAGSPVDAKSNLRTRVDARLCMLCHGPQRPQGLPADADPRQFYQISLSQLQVTGADLYDLTCSGCHRSLGNSQVRGKKTREIEEAINENKGGMAPLGVLTTAQIQTISAALAE